MLKLPVCTALLLLLTKECRSVPQPNRQTLIVYDVYTPLNKTELSQPFMCNRTMNSMLPEGLLFAGVYNRFQVVNDYIPEKQLNTSTTNQTKDDRIQLFSKQNITLESSVIVDRAQFCKIFDPLAEKDEKYLDRAIVLNFLFDPPVTCKQFCLYTQQTLPTEPTEGTKFGLEMDATTIQCFKKSCSHLLAINEILVFKVSLYNTNMQLSYSAFTRQMKNFEEAMSAVPNIPVYLNVDIVFTSGIAPEKRNVVWYYIRQFALHWLNDKKNVTLLLPYSREPENVPTNLQNIYPVVTSLGENKLHCQLRDSILFAGLYFDRIFIESEGAAGVGSILNLEKCVRPFQPNKQGLLVSVQVEGNSDYQILKGLSARVQNFKTFQLIVFYTKTTWRNNLTFVSNIPATYNDSNICVPVIRDAYRKQSRFCQYAYQNKDRLEVSSNPQAQLGVIFTPGVAIWERTLTEMRNDRKHFQKLANGTQVRIQLDLRHHPKPVHVETDKHLKRNLFCSDVLTYVHETYNSFLLFAQIHDFDVITYPLMDTDTQIGFWHNLATDSALNRTVTDYPVLVKRVPPEYLEYNLPKIPFSYPCIHAKEKPDATHFGNSVYSGISVDLEFPRNSPLSTKEIEGLIYIAFSAFPALEVISTSLKEVDDVLSAVNGKLVQSLWNDTSQPLNSSILIELTSAEFSRSRFQKLQSLRVNHVGLHVMEWSRDDNDNIFEMLATNDSSRTHAVKLGITIHNCVEEINVNMTTIIEFQYLDAVSYIVCVVEGKPVFDFENQAYDLQIYFDTHLYIQRYFKSVLEKDTMFRITFKQNNCTDNSTADAYLKFLHIANKFAKGHQIKYFLGDAFLNCSWWLVNDYSNLLNHQVYTERISGQKPSNFVEKETVINTATQKIALVVGVSLALVALLSLIIGVWVYDRRRLKKILTKEEVDVFNNGEETEFQEALEAGTIELSTVKKAGFKKKFKIKKKHIQIGEQVGKGNFGQVFKGTLYGNQTVAIKIPLPSCSKEEFTTLLAEVKVLSYIGIHENVLRFFGAYVKQIDVGIIFVLTEFCENGNLEAYLRKKRPNPVPQVTHKDSESDIELDGYKPKSAIMAKPVLNLSVDTKELARFAYEIASGMEYISDKRVVHSDLSTRNVFLNAENTCKIGDFGLSRKLYENSAYFKQGDEELPWQWMAIESLRNMEFTTKSDVWSFGVTLWEIYTFGKTPYSGITSITNFSQELENGFRMSKPEYASDEIYIKIRDCWNLSPDARPLFSDLRAYFKEVAYPRN